MRAWGKPLRAAGRSSAYSPAGRCALVSLGGPPGVKEGELGALRAEDVTNALKGPGFHGEKLEFLALNN